MNDSMDWETYQSWLETRDPNPDMPYARIDWGSTKAFVTFYCSCGKIGEVCDWDIRHYYCYECKRYFAMSAYARLIELNLEEKISANKISEAHYDRG